MSATFWALNGGSGNDVIVTTVGTGGNPRVIAFGNGKYALFGNIYGVAASAAIATSSDGVTFSTPTITDSTAEGYYVYCQSGIYANSMFVFAGNVGSGAGFSIDGDVNGTTFTLRDSSSGIKFGYSLLWDGARFLSVQSTKIGTSTTGLNSAWTDATINAGYNFYGLAFDGTTYVAVGQTGAIYTSTNRTTWTARTSGVTTTLTSVVYESSIGLFVAVSSDGSPGSIITSPDGVTWTSRTNPTTGAFRSVVWSASHAKYFAVGNSIIYSSDGITWAASTYKKNVAQFNSIAFNGLQAVVTEQISGVVYKSDKGFIF